MGDDMHDGFFIRNGKTLITDEGPNPNPQAKEVIAYLEGHPFVTDFKWFTIRDLNKEEKAKATKVSSKREVLEKLYVMNEQELRETFLAGRIDAKGNFEELKNRVQTISDAGDSGVAKLYDALYTQDKEYRVTIAMGISKGIVYYNSGKYRMGSSNGPIIGYDEDQVVMYLKENKDDFAYIQKAVGEITSEKANDAITHVEQRTKSHKLTTSKLTSGKELQEKLAKMKDEAKDAYVEESDEDMKRKANQLANH